MEPTGRTAHGGAAADRHRDRVVAVAGLVLLAAPIGGRMPQRGTREGPRSARARRTAPTDARPAARRRHAARGQGRALPGRRPSTAASAIEVAFGPSRALHDKSFAFLAGKKYFDGTRPPPHHRGPSCVLQCGDPSGTGRAVPATRSARGPPTADPEYPAGMLAMARTNGPEHQRQPVLHRLRAELGSPHYTVFGKVTKGPRRDPARRQGRS